MPAAVTIPEAPMLPVVSEAEVKATAVTPAADTVPEEVTDDAVNGPVLIEFAVMVPAPIELVTDKVPAVREPLVDSEAKVPAPEVDTPPAPKWDAAALSVPVAVRVATVALPADENDALVRPALVLRPLPPATTPLALTIPLAVTCAAVTTPLVVTALAVTAADEDNPALVTDPPVDTLLPVIAPAAIEPALNAPVAVMAPDTDALLPRRWPVTLNALATRLPTTVVVRLTSPPTTTSSAAGPKRTTPLVAPVPASSTRSPPLLEL